METVPTYFAQCLAMLNKVDDCILGFEMGSLIYNARRDLALQAIQQECDYVMWFDSDMMFSSNILEYFVDALNNNPEIDILSGMYFRRNKPYTPVIFERLRMNDDGSVFWRNYGDDYPRDDIFEVEGIGFGGVIMRTKVLIDVQSEFGTMFNPINGMGEDLAFSWRARKLGYKLWCDSRVKFGHVAHFVVTEDFYDSFKQSE